MTPSKTAKHANITKKENTMHNPEKLASAIAKAMDSAGYGISDQLLNALEDEFKDVIEVDQEEGNFTALDTFLDALEYAANRLANTYNDQ